MEVNDIFLREAIRIGDNIIQSAIKTQDGWYWNVLEPSGETTIKHGFYNGCSGIIYYLVDLYNETNNESYYQGVREGCRWLMNAQYDLTKTNFAFFTGIGSFACLFAKVYEINEDISYRNFVHDLTYYNIKDYSKNGMNLTCDVLSGRAGIILSLLHLYNFRNEDWIIDEIYTSVDFLLTNGIYTENGICWDRSLKNMHPLCGFAHGTSGIAFVFLELYRIFGNDFFYQIAQNAFSYENHHYDSKVNNWPDFRKDVSFYKDLDIYKADRNQYHKKNYMSAWCHGAPGIGMANLYSYQFKKDYSNLRAFKNALASNEQFLLQPMSELYSYTLCHGHLGNNNLLIDGYVILGDQNLYDKASKVGESALNESTKTGFYKSGFPKLHCEADSSLFLGTAGIGHYYLRLNNPRNLTSALLPTVSNKQRSDTVREYDNERATEIITRKLFRHTLSNISEIPKIKSHKSGNSLNTSIGDNVANLVQQNDTQTLKKAFKIDQQRNEVLNLECNDTLLYAMHNYTMKSLIGIPIDNIFTKKLIVNPYIVFGEDNIIFLPFYIEEGVLQYEIGTFIFEMLQELSVTNNVLLTYEKMYKNYSISSENEEQFRRIFINKMFKSAEMFLLVLAV